MEILTTGNFATSNPFSLCLYTHARKKENLGTSSTHSFDVLLSIFPFRSSQPFGFVTMQPAKFNPRRMLISSHADIRPKFEEFLDNIAFLFARVFLLEIIGLKDETFTSPELCEDVFFCLLFMESLDLCCLGETS